MSLTQFVRRALATDPDAIVTVCGGRRRTARQFVERIARLAGALRSLGVRCGDRVGILSANSDRYVEVHLGVPWAGAAVNPVNTRWSVAEIAHSLDDCDTRVLLVDDPFLPLLDARRRRRRSLQTLIHVGDGAPPAGLLGYEDLVADATAVADARRGGSDLAGVYYTGGTTGFPKGVMLSHAALCFNAQVLAAQGIARPGERGLHAAPLFHIAAVSLLNALWLVGGTHVALPAFTPLAALQALERERIQTVVMVPTMVQLTVDHPQAAGHDLSSLRALAYGGSPISEAVLDRAQRLLPQVDFMQVYGMTEAAPTITVLPPALHTAAGRRRGKLRTAGLAAPGIELRVVDPEGHELAPGAVGEIVVRSPALMLGYWNRPAETAATVRDGWLHTGDAGCIDAEGFLAVVDRLKDMIVSGGENVYSVEVEQALASHPAVAACAVIGVPDPDWGERVHAVVVARPGQAVDAVALRAHCKASIAGYKCPRSIEVVAALPMSGAGKVLKSVLRAPFWAGRERQVA